jgi:tetratricopeptide (TPR) repeat protein
MKNRKLYLLIILLLFTSLIRAQVIQNAKQYVRMYNEGFFKEAIDNLNQLDSSKRSADEWFYLAQSYNAIKDINPAVAGYKRAVQINPAHNGYRLFYARALNIYGDIPGATENYQKIIETDSLNNAALYDLGSLYLNSKKYLPAIPYFEKLVAINGNDFLSRYSIALASFNSDPTNPDSNVIPTQLAFCLITNPRYNPARELLGLYHYTKGNYRAALTEYQILTWNRNVHPDIHYRAGQCLEKLRSYPAAIGSYKEAVKLDSTNVNYFTHLGYCYFLTSNLDSAVLAYKHASKLEDGNSTIYINLGMVYSNIDSLVQASEYFLKADAVSSVKQTEFIYNQLGYLYLRMKELKMAKYFCEKTLVLNDGNIVAKYNLARVNDEMGQLKTALKLYEEVLPRLQENESKQKEFEFAESRIKQLKGK